MCVTYGNEKETFIDQTHYAHKRSHMGFFSNLNVFYLHVLIVNTLIENYIFVLFCFASLLRQHCAERAALNAAMETKMFIELSSAYN